MGILSKPVYALIFYVFAMALIPLNDALIKLLSESMSIFQVLGLRSLFSLAVILAIPVTFPALVRMKLSTALKLAFRGFCLVGAMIFFFLPLASLSLAEVTAIFFISPLFITLLSVPILGEKLGMYRVLAVLIGLVGVLIIVRPGSDGFQTAYLLPLISASSYAAFQIITRYIRNEAPVIAMVAVQNLVYMVTGLVGMLMIYIWQPEVPDSEIMGFLLRSGHTPTLLENLFLVLAGMIVLNLSFASTNVYTAVEATTVAPLEYVAIPTAVLWGILIWNDWPDLNAWIGMSLIIAGGIIVIYRENIRHREIASSVPMRAAATNTVTEPGSS